MERPADCKPVKIQLKKDCKPYSLHTARRIPIPLLEKVKEELITMIVADTLSRSPQGQDAESSTKELDDVEAHVDAVRISWSATDKRLEEIASESQKDSVISGAPRYIKEGWLQIHRVRGNCTKRFVRSQRRAQRTSRSAH